MTTPFNPPHITRKLIVDVVDARNLLPKDGQGSSSPYVVAEFDGQKKRTSTQYRELNPAWNESLEFTVSDPKNMEHDALEIEVYNDKKYCNVSGRKNHFLGRVKLYGSQFSKQGEEGLVYFRLEKKSVFSWIRGDIGLRIYYYDELVEEEQPQPQPPQNMPPPEQPSQETPPPVLVQPPEEAIQAADMRNMQSSSGGTVWRLMRPNGEYSPKVINNRRAPGECTTERIHPYDLVEPMTFLFVKIVKARGLGPNESPYVQITASSQRRRTKQAAHRPGEPIDSPEWNQVFLLSYNKNDSPNLTLEISVWDSRLDRFLGGVCFDLSDVHVRDPPDSPLAPRWYRLDGGAPDESSIISGDLQLAVWIGTQADDAFSEAWSTDAPFVAHTRSKVYQSPKLWYLRVTVIEAQELHLAYNLPPLTAPQIKVNVELGFRSLSTKLGFMNTHSSSFQWNDDLIFVASEPFEESLNLSVVDSTNREATELGRAAVPVSSIDKRIDERQVASRWLQLECRGTRIGCHGQGQVHYSGRLKVRLCLEGGYHVLDEAAHVCSDFTPTAKELWKPAIGILELGILGARGLVPLSGMTGGRINAYCVAKYGKKWVRTRTIPDSADPRWNEKYTWQVYDPCTVITIGVFDNWQMLDISEDKRIGKIRIRVSTLENNKVHTTSYPLLVLSDNGLKKMGEIELAIRFCCPSMLLDTCSVYCQPLLPRMHYLKPLGVAQQEALRVDATRIVATWLARSEPPLGSEVVRYMLDADSHTWSMRKSKANWFRILGVLSWAVGLATWLRDIRWWKNPVTTVLVHVLYLVLVWYPDLIVPTGFLYIVLIGIWYYRFRPKIPSGMDTRLSQAESVDVDDLDEEFDPIPSLKPPEIIRRRYLRLRKLAGKVQTILGDIATQGERVQALVSWRDPRASKLFIGVCIVITLALYAIPPKMVAVALGFYYLRHPMFRDRMPPASWNFFRRLPSLSDRLM